MESLPNAVDYGDAPSFVAAVPYRAYFTSPHTLRVTFARWHQRDTGKMELRVCGHIDWDVDDFVAANAWFSEKISAILTKGFQPSDSGQPARRAAH